MTTGNTCPACGNYAGRREDGTLFPHQRYADGAGYGPNQSHDQVTCEGSGSRPREERSDENR
jgi:hypothetical protein